MLSSRKLLKNAAILTGSGIAARIMGFFFRIFLSHTFGEENVGLYQLIFPVYALCLSISTAGIQTAVSKTVAEKTASGKQEEAGNVLAASLVFTVFLSLIEIIILQQNSGSISEHFLGDIRCEKMLLILSYALPFAAVHSCICGYCLGLQQTKLPAFSQLVEQVFRILFVFTACLLTVYSKKTPSIHLAAAGIAVGELLSTCYSLNSLSRSRPFRRPPVFSGIRRELPALFRLSAPLTASRTAVTLLQSVEAASIPACLKAYGLSGGDALKIYGVLTGMALPCILFPSALTNSIGTVLMPAVSAAKASGNRNAVPALLKKAAGSCFLLGLCCCLAFLISGNFIGSILFHSSTAGNFILTLSWICPFLYTNTALVSAINGLGKTSSTFLINTASLLVRIAGVFLAIPEYGIRGYLVGLLISQFLVSILSSIIIYRELTAGTAQTGI